MVISPALKLAVHPSYQYLFAIVCIYQLKALRVEYLNSAQINPNSIIEL